MTKRIFDELETIPDFLESIAEESIYEETGIRYENVKQRVMSEICPKKRKKYWLWIVAAVILTISVSTTVIASLGGFSQIFGELFSGDLNDENLYTVSRWDFHSDNDNLQAEVLGVTGDESTVYAVLELSLKNGKPIIHNPKSEFSIFNKGREMVYVTVDKNILQQIRFPLSNGLSSLEMFDNGWHPTKNDGEGSGAVLVSGTADCQKLRMYIRYNRSVTPRGNTMTIQCDGLYEKIPDTLIASSQDRESLYSQNPDNTETRIIEKDGEYELYAVKETELDINFELSMPLNYQLSEKTISFSKEAIETIYPDTAHSGNMVFSSSKLYLSPIGITMISNYTEPVISDVSPEGSYEVSDEVSTGESIPPPAVEEIIPTENDILNGRIEWFQYENPHGFSYSQAPSLYVVSQIIMEDGTVYYPKPNGDAAKNNTAVATYAYVREHDFNRAVVIDVNKIKKIVINGFAFGADVQEVNASNLPQQSFDWDDPVMQKYLDYAVKDILGDGVIKPKLDISEEQREQVMERIQKMMQDS